MSDMEINVTAVNARTTRDKQVVINIMIEINDIEQLRKVIKQLKKIDDVSDAYRVKA